jgi:uncharacterized protein YjbI with pentapeptide repeats
MALYRSNNEAHEPPFSKVEFYSRGEIDWVMRTLQWSGERDSIGSRHADFREAIFRKVTIGDIALREVDLSGAVLEECDWGGAYLAEAKLANVFARRANFRNVNLDTAHLDMANLHRSNFRGAFLKNATFQNTNLNCADLEQAYLLNASFNGAQLGQTNLRGADLRGATFDSTTRLHRTCFDARTRLGGVDWDGALLNEIDWSAISQFGEEADAGEVRQRKYRATSYRIAASMYHSLSRALKGQGLAASASKFRWREQVMERKALYWGGDWAAWFVSYLLDFVAGYGEKPFRTVSVYISLIAGFALLYFGLSNEIFIPISTDAGSLSLPASVVLSLTAFHGTGFFFRGPADLADPLFIVSAIEGVFGLFVEAIFVAAFSRRFLGHD